MDKIIKYNTYDHDIRKGDIVVFLNGSRKEIKKIDDHRVTFIDDSKIDLYVVEIEGIIKIPRAQIVPKSPTFQSKSNSIDELLDILAIKKDCSSKTLVAKLSSNNNYITYEELFKRMESADHSDLEFSKYFWHYTTLSNLVSIINKGKFLSRYNIEGEIPYDNKEHNLTSRDVMFGNLSWKTKAHVRFYLRPLNKPFFALYGVLPEVEKRNYCVLCIKKEALKKSFKSTFLYYQTANKATNDVYEKEYELNQKQESSFFMNNLEKFDFAETYSIYDKNQDHQRSLYQEAEFLVWKELSFFFVDKIYFRTQDGMNIFLIKIRTHKDYNDIKKKCVVDWRYFGYRD